MPVLMGDSWPFNGCRTVAEDAVDAEGGAEAQEELVVLCEMEVGWIWCRASIHGGDCGNIIWLRSSEPRLPTVLDADHDKILSWAPRRRECSIAPKWDDWACQRADRELVPEVAESGVKREGVGVLGAAVEAEVEVELK